MLSGISLISAQWMPENRQSAVLPAALAQSQRAADSSRKLPPFLATEGAGCWSHRGRLSWTLVRLSTCEHGRDIGGVRTRHAATTTGGRPRDPGRSPKPEPDISYPVGSEGADSTPVASALSTLAST